MSARYVKIPWSPGVVVGRIATGVKVRPAPEAEKRVLEVLQAVSSYSITADAMSMTGSGGTLRFRALVTEVKP